MFTRKAAIDTARLFVDEMKAIGYNPTQAWVFGSTVNGNANEYSDIDVAMWDKQFTGVSFFDAEKFVQLLVKYHPIEIHTYRDGVTETDNPFIGEIKRTGERIL